MDVPGQDRREPDRDVSCSNDVGGGGEGEVGRSDHRAFHALVEDEQARVRTESLPSGGRDQIREPGSNVVPFRRKPCKRDAPPSHVGDERSRAIEQMDPRVLREPDLRNSSALVVAGDDEDRNPTIGDTCQRLESLPRDARWNSRPVEHIATVDDQVDFTGHRGPERRLIVREKIVSSATALDTCAHRQVEPEVRVREEEDPDAVGHLDNLTERLIVARPLVPVGFAAVGVVGTLVTGPATFELELEHDGIVSISPSFASLVLNGERRDYTAVVYNPTGAPLQGVVVQQSIDQGSSSSPAGGVALSCTSTIEQMPPGACTVSFNVGAANTPLTARRCRQAAAVPRSIMSHVLSTAADLVALGQRVQ